MANDFFNQWNQPESEDRLELVFEDRNQTYGAYVLRSKYRRYKVLATVIACSCVALVTAVPLIQEMNKPKNKGGSKNVKVEAKTLDDIKEPEEKKKDEPPPPEPPPVKVAMQQFTIPEIDPNAESEANLPPNTNVLNPGDKTQDGQNEYFPPDNTNTGGDGTFGGDSKDPVKADVQAKFVGGDEAFIEYVKNNFQYPSRCQDEGINGYVLLRFVVDKAGNVSNVTMIEETPSCKEFTEEAIRVLRASPQWIPGMANGRFVKSYRVVPIRLNLN